MLNHLDFQLIDLTFTRLYTDAARRNSRIMNFIFYTKSFACGFLYDRAMCGIIKTISILCFLLQ